MSLLDKSQTVMVYQPGQPAVPVDCQLQPVKPELVYEYVGRITMYPHQLLADPETEPLFKVGTKVVNKSGRIFTVIYPPLQQNADDSPAGFCSHIEVYVEDAGIKSV